MQPRPSFDRALLIPIAIGVVSILGIWWIVSDINLRGAFIPPTAISTAIPFDGGSLETDIAAFYPTHEDIRPAATATSADADTGSLTETLPATSTLITESPPTPSATY